MKNRNSYHRQVFYDAYSTYIQASKQAIRDKKTNLKRRKHSQSQEKTIQNQNKI